MQWLYENDSVRFLKTLLHICGMQVVMLTRGREKVGEISLERTNIFTDSFAIGMELGDAAGELTEMDRVSIYWRCVSEMNKTYSDD